MIRFEEMKLDENSPIYMQIIDFIRGGLAAGTIVYGDELPSRRVLSAILGINPNTVAKAYQELELQGYVYTVAGKGCFVSQVNIEADIQGNKIKEFKQVVMDCHKFNIEKELLISSIESIYEGGMKHAEN